MKITVLTRRVNKFLSDPHCRSSCVKTDFVTVYLRKSDRYIHGALHDCLDLANIEVPETLWRQGIARATIQFLEKGNPYYYIFVENATNPILHSALKRWGWQQHELPFSLYKANPKHRFA